MYKCVLSVGLVVAMLALLATSADEAALNVGEAEAREDAETLNNLLLGNLLQSRVDRSWRKPCEGNSCFRSGGRGWKRTDNRGSPFSMDGFKCVGESCGRGWKRTSQRKR